MADGALQYVLPHRPFALPVVDFTNEAEPAQAVDAWLVANNHQRMDLVRGPLVYANLLRTKRDEHLLAMTFHHLVIDGLSQELLLQELAADPDELVRYVGGVGQRPGPGDGVKVAVAHLEPGLNLLSSCHAWMSLPLRLEMRTRLPVSSSTR